MKVFKIKEKRQILAAMLIASYYKAHFYKYEFDGIKFNMRFIHIPRWYSPVFWILMLISFLWSFFDGGVIRYFKDTKGIFDTSEENNNVYQFKNTFKEGVPMWERKLILFRLIYLNQ